MSQQDFQHTVNYPQGRRRKKWPWVVGITLAALFAACGLGTLALKGSAEVVDTAIKQAEASVAADNQERMSDVKLSSCKGSGYGTVEVKYTIVNSGKEPRNYLLDIEMTTPDGTRVGTATGFADDVAPGKTVKGTAMGTLEGKPKKFKCVLTEA